jgi:hypothetical protein
MGTCGWNKLHFKKASVYKMQAIKKPKAFFCSGKNMTKRFSEAFTLLPHSKAF